MAKPKLTDAQETLMRRAVFRPASKARGARIFDGWEHRVGQNLVNKGLASWNADPLSYRSVALQPTEAGREVVGGNDG